MCQKLTTGGMRHCWGAFSRHIVYLLFVFFCIDQRSFYNEQINKYINYIDFNKEKTSHDQKDQFTGI